MLVREGSGKMITVRFSFDELVVAYRTACCVSMSHRRPSDLDASDTSGVGVRSAAKVVTL